MMINALLALPARIRRKISNMKFIDQRAIYALWEQMHLARVLEHFQVDCVFDIGANEGQYARMLREKAGYKGLIISFEPNPEMAARARNAAKGDPKRLVEELAISKQDGEQHFNVMVSSEFSSFSTPKHDETGIFAHQNQVSKKLRVRTETLSTAFNRLQPVHRFQRAFLKLDTQGYDVEIIEHAGPELERFIGLQSELAVKKLYESSVDFRVALSVYERHGFVLSAIVPNNAGHFPFLIETDCIMVRRASAPATGAA
jgi:FkbM family methyltransferase